MIVLDEPTNDLDLPSLRMLEEALVDFAGSVLVVSHDRYFLDRICDQIISFEDGGIFVQPGNYSYYLEKKLEREQRLKEPRWEVPSRDALPKKGTPLAARPEPPPAARPRKLSFKEQRELDGMEATVLAAEKRATEIQTTLNDPNFYATRGGDASRLIDELEQTNAEITRLYARWAELDAIGK
jgi:ATP-binding cassette subfamily F protein uup